ncbi:glyoxalase [Staphylococcus sp. 17KM0847]|uniref:glyoxalase n=1 Tax=Staphylococcus sp. 17KM0847 TaxID=2583989 RepID=UPI0015DF2D7C|nr:glyoxalase [Staphylococcus sp. 17KM0847]
MNHLRLAKYQDIMLIAQEDFEVGNASYLNLLVSDITHYADTISPQFIVSELTDQPWNAKELTIKDPDGHLITLTQPNITDIDFNTLIKTVTQKY